MLINEVTDPQLLDYKNKISSALRSDVKLYRGTSNVSIPDVSLQAMRSDRLPRDSSRLAVFIFDSIMKANRWPFRKSNTTSVSISPKQAKLYGDLLRVYPIDGTVFLYSTQVYDWLPSINRILVKIYMSALKVYPELRPNGDMYNFDLLLSHPDYINQWIVDNLEEINSQLDLHVTTDINELQYAKGEILMWSAAKNFVAVRADNAN